MKKDTKGYYRETGTVNGIRYDVRAKSKEELKRKVREKIRALEDGLRIADSNVTVNEWAAQWCSIYKTGIRKASIERINGQIWNFISPIIGYMPVNKVLPLHCQEVLNQMSGNQRIL